MTSPPLAPPRFLSKSFSARVCVCVWQQGPSYWLLPCHRERQSVVDGGGRRGGGVFVTLVVASFMSGGEGGSLSTTREIFTNGE